MDYTYNGYEFMFETEKIRLYQGKYNYAAKTIEVRDSGTRAVVATSIGWEVYGRDQQDALRAAREQAKEWAESQLA
jgi:hypothetical protein